MKKLLNRPEAILVAFGLIFLAAAVLLGAFPNNTPHSSQVIYVSDADKDRLISEGDAATLIVNINTATKEELQQLDGVGEALAERIVAYREEQGGFESADDLLNVKGIGESTIENLRPYIKVE